MQEFKSCAMCSGVFLKSDGTFTCGCNAGYNMKLADAREIKLSEFLESEKVRHIRNSFRNNTYPWEICSYCIARLSCDMTDYRTSGISMHIEPTNNCNLQCPQCTSSYERSMPVPPKRHYLEVELFRGIIDDLHENHLSISALAFCGYGEPALNKHLPEMASYLNTLYPDIYSYLDTNASLPAKLAVPLADCGLKRINLGIDGINQESYEKFRKNGNFGMCMEFMKALVETRNRTGSKTQIVWKYILFDHNDSDDAIAKVINICNELKIDVQFHLTSSENHTKRSRRELYEKIGRERIAFYLDDAFLNEEK